MIRETHWHIFCRVIDNFGDIGVCWRLARQLVRDHKIPVTLWVDDLTSFNAIWPSIQTKISQQMSEGVQIRHWSMPFAEVEPGQVVIEAFGCALPSNYLQAMIKTKPLWINLEYLSAEEWVKDCHLSQSPVNGLRKTFYFPGFEADTGGLLWDQALTHLPLRFNNYENKIEYLQQLGASCQQPASEQEPPLLISLFSYENTALPELLKALSEQPKAVMLLVPEGRMAAGIQHWLGKPLNAGEQAQRGQLTLIGLRFMNQDQYDNLLALCDLNFVRGEESFVRTQMLAKPFIWHIYPQEAQAHMQKLEAFLNLYLAEAPPLLAAAVHAATHAWNQPSLTSKACWLALLQQLPALSLHSLRWRTKMISQGDLTSNVVHFCSNQV